MRSLFDLIGESSADLRGPGRFMRIALIELCVTCTLALTIASARAQDFLNQEWLLDPAVSTVYMQTVKANAIFETHQFSVVEGSISSSGDANIRIDLASIHSGIATSATRACASSSSRPSSFPTRRSTIVNLIGEVTQRATQVGYAKIEFGLDDVESHNFEQRTDGPAFMGRVGQLSYFLIGAVADYQCHAFVGERGGGHNEKETDSEHPSVRQHWHARTPGTSSESTVAPELSNW